ncbi:hypothetical protein DJ71_03860 [Halorubrum sp. E3]|nr:hypothetical protein DJ71_03860 [Halorubrum sp. E3]
MFRFCQGGSPRLYKSLDLKRRVTIEDGYVEYRHFHPLHEAVKAPMLLGYPNLFAGWTLRHASDGLRDRISEADVILVREPWQFETVDELTPESTPIVYSSHNVETERFAEISRPLFDRRTMDRVRKLEQYAVDHADMIVTTSERDADVYRTEFGSAVPHVVAPNGTYEDAIRPHEPDTEGVVELRSRYDIAEDATVCLFMGSDYQPNVVAAEHVVELARELPSVEFVVMGTVGNSLSSGEVPDNVTIIGYVEDDFEAHFDLADIALNPMTKGGGTNIKLIDYFARSLPVVSTPFGARGIEVTDGEEIVVAEIGDFSAAISELGTESALRIAIGAAARERASDRYTWEAGSNKMRSAFVEHFLP